MKLKLLSAFMALLTSIVSAQQKNFFRKSNAKSIENKAQLPTQLLFDIDVNALKASLANSPKRAKGAKTSDVIMELPNANGQMERYRIFEDSNMHPDLAARYPEIKSYFGIGVDNPTSTTYFSISPLGFKSMALNADKPAVYIEPLSGDSGIYSVYKSSDRSQNQMPFECGSDHHPGTGTQTQHIALRPNADDGKLRKYRLAVSATGEYTAYFGGTKALALAAINNTMTRVNGIFEKDLGVRMELIANNDILIYTNAETDPYSASSMVPDSNTGIWNQEIQNTLTSVIGNAGYDIGHLFIPFNRGGKAAVGCVCLDNSKGWGWSSSGVPHGDGFDITIVSHEFGHQFGAYHTFSHQRDNQTANMEPGSGSTIMSYGGNTGYDFLPSRTTDPYFHAVSIQQATDVIKSRTCQTNVATGNAVPGANAGIDYTIPKSTPFVLTGTASDSNNNLNSLTYNWEQFDAASVADTLANSAPRALRITGPTFRSYPPSSSRVRCFPKMSSILNGLTTTPGAEIISEALPSVARTMNFRFTVRDNNPGGGANNSDDTVITVNGTAGPFSVTSQNTAASYLAGSTQTITWDVAGTTGNGINAANVDILISTDGGTTWTTLLAATPNDGSQAVTIPNIIGTTNRIMVKGTNHIFFDVSNANFSIVPDTIPPTAPSLYASGTTPTTTYLYWSPCTDNASLAGYDVYKGGILLGSTTSAFYNVSGLSNATAYTFTVKARDAAGNVAVSNQLMVVTGAYYCTSQGNITSDERIGRVQLGTINNPSTGIAGYENFTAISTNLAKGNASTITITPTWPGNVYNEYYVVFIDYNQDGDFTDAGENVWSLSGSYANPVSGTFTVPLSALNGSTRMRVSMQYANLPVSCGSFMYGQVEDYTVVLIADTPPTAPVLSVIGTTPSSVNLSWYGATDNIGVTGYDVYCNGVLVGSTTSTSYAVSGLVPSTVYSFYVKAKDISGNTTASNVVSATTLSLVNTVSYCTSQGNNTNDERIGRVQFAGINNPSTGTAGYENFTSVSTNVSKGTTYTISITPQWTGTIYNEGYAVFIDYNQDGDFTDAGETVLGISPSQASVVSGSFTIPTNAVSGNTRMRVSMKYSGIPLSCEAFEWGQVEDYTIVITGPSSVQSYCTLSSTNTNDERIGRVQFGQINNYSTGAAGYENFTYLSTSVNRGSTNSITIVPSWLGIIYHEAYAVYIDYNQDGDFTDPGEKAYTAPAGVDPYVIGNITIPATAAIGATRMRVVMQYSAVPDSPCGSFTFGQVEDYTVIINTAVISRTQEGDNQIAVTLYPNPVKGEVLNIGNLKGKADYRIFNLFGQEVTKGSIENERIYVGGLPSGTYLIEVSNESGVVSKKFMKQ